MLDLSAVFDTIDHELLLYRFEACFGIQSEAKEWLKSYFSNRQQVVRIKRVNSDHRVLKTGIPQVSVIGPFSFPQYTSLLFKIAHHSSMRTMKTPVPEWKHASQMSDVGWHAISSN